MLVHESSTLDSILGQANASTARCLWQALAGDTNSGVMIADADGVVLYANAAAVRTFSKSSDSPVGKGLGDLWDERLASERLDLLRQAAATGQVVHLEGFVNGRWVHSTLRPLGTDERGKVRVLMVCRGSRSAGTASEAGVIQARENDAGNLSNLTQRELDILKLIGEGLSTAAIAAQLERSVKTIEWHRVSLGNKLGVRNRVELARIAINAGLVSADNRMAAATR